MALLNSRTALVVLVTVLLSLAGCHHQSAETGPLYIMLMYNGGACEQNGSQGILEVYENQAVIYQTAAELAQFQVRFTACPFASCPVDSPHGMSVNIGQPNPGMVGTTFNYSGMSISNQQCTDAASMGVHVNPAR